MNLIHMFELPTFATINLAPEFYFSGLLLLGVIAQWVAWRVRLPAIVLLLAFGFLGGYLFGAPDRFINQDQLFPLVSLAVGIVLFEGGLSLQFREIKETGRVVTRLVTVGLFVTLVLTAFASRWALGWSWEMSVLLGALLTVSGPTVILPLLRHVRPVRRISSLVKWEGIVNDPIGAVIAALVFEVIAHHHLTGDSITSEAFRDVGLTLVGGASIGIVTAFVLVQLLRRYLIPDYLQNPAILGIVVFVFAFSNYLMEESGLVSVTILGIALANQRTVTVKHVIEFKENLRVLLISTLFLVLASRVQIGWEEIESLSIRGSLFVAALILLVRPISVFIATINTGISWQERVFLSWIHPRGIVAAAVASLFALELEKIPAFKNEAQEFVLVVFLVIVVTVTLYGLTLGPLAKYLGLSGQNPQGVLFAGASPLFRSWALAIHEEGFPVVLVDTNHANVTAAKMAGMPAFFASIGSEFVHEEIDFAGIGRLVAVTPNDEVNTFAVMEYAEHFGSAEVYQLAIPESTNERLERVPSHRRGRILFNPEITYKLLDDQFEAGAVIKKTTLSEDFSYGDFVARYGSAAVILCTVQETTGQDKKLLVNAADIEEPPVAGMKVIALVQPLDEVVSL